MRGSPVSGQSEEFAAFFERTAPGMVRRARLLCGRRADAEDAVADAYTEAWRRWARIGGYEAPEAWVHRVMCQRLWKSARNQRKQVPTGLELPVPAHVPAEQAALVTEILGTVAALPRRQYLVVSLHALGLSHQEIAGALGVSPRTVAVHLFRGRQTLRTALDLTPAGTAGRDRLLPAARQGADPVTAAIAAAYDWLGTVSDVDGLRNRVLP